MPIGLEEFLEQLDDINTAGGYRLKQEKKKAFAELVEVAAAVYAGGKIKVNPAGDTLISEPYAKAILPVLKKHAKVFDVDPQDLPEVDNMTKDELDEFEKVIIKKYKALLDIDALDLQKVRVALAAVDKKVKPAIVNDPALDAEIVVLKDELALLEGSLRESTEEKNKLAAARLELDAQTKLVEDARRDWQTALRLLMDSKGDKIVKQPLIEDNQTKRVLYLAAQAKESELKAVIDKLDKVDAARAALDAQTKLVGAAQLELEAAVELKKLTHGKKAKKPLFRDMEEKKRLLEAAQKKEFELNAVVDQLELEKQTKENPLNALLANGKTIEEVIVDKKAELELKNQDKNKPYLSENTQKKLSKSVEIAVEAQKKLADSSDPKVIIAEAKKYEEAITALKKFETNKDNPLEPELNTALHEAIKPKTKIELSSGTGYGSNMVMLVNDEFDGWDHSKYLDTPESFKDLPVKVNSTDSLAFSSQPENLGASHVFVRVEDKKDDSPNECIVSKKEFDVTGGAKQWVVLKQELEGAKVTNLTSDMSKLSEKDKIEVAMMQARMLLDNYKPGFTNITIRIKDPEMAARVHAAVLLMKGDTLAKSCTVENKNKASYPGRSAEPGKMESLTGSFCKSWLGPDIYDVYKRSYRTETLKHKEAMAQEIKKNKRPADDDFDKPEGSHPRPRS